MPHFDLTVESSTLDQLFGFLSAKGFAVDFDARSMTIYGAGATESDADSSHADNPLSTLQHWYAVIRGLRVGVCLGWSTALSYMIDEFGAMVPGTHALHFPTEAATRRAFNAATERNEVQTIQLVREYIIID